MKNKLLLLAVGLALTTQIIIAQVPSYVPTNGLVGYWGFSGNASDISGNGSNGTVNGALLSSDRFGNATSAYNFNGNSDYIIVQNNLLPNQQSYSINLWTKIQGNQTIDLFNDRQEPSCFYKYRVLVINGVIQFWKYSNSSLEKVIGNTIPLNQWIMITAVFDNTQNTINIYSNSSLNSSSSSSNWNVSSNATTIGGLRGCGTNGTFNIQNGPIDDVGIWNRALTQDEITNLYYSDNTCQSLVINTGVLSFNPPTYNNTVTIYPNPANDHITIDCGNLANVSGWTIKIVNTLGQEVFSGAMNTQQYVVPLNSWSGQGVYFVKIYDASNNLLNTKKIILQ
jgi:hypothetical protein